ncbi:hypothetical protein [Flavobacterium capsici]|uniref:Uncharacterized protein n=1 Tax=Flavobacterium capsici TaxID=3075618 RepID=A0AA96F3S1_9FLAO|nr:MULTISPECIES: hypothetical protein [unclassified Flavobacterium]WNM18442.1 hypothetical protein RN608_10510 [Flavobacterium sp. PMR2A8]WNM22493.1 hypothetical protein RN605_03810 [Flavobacterium sp. PMTSA4]
MDLKLDDLIKNLIIISSEKEEQLNLIGYGNVGTEMLINFGISNKKLSGFFEQNLINQKQKEKLEEFQAYIDEKANLDDNLDSEEWNKTRLIAKEILIILKANNYRVYLDKSGKFWEPKLIM